MTVHDIRHGLVLDLIPAIGNRGRGQDASRQSAVYKICRKIIFRTQRPQLCQVERRRVMTALTNDRIIRFAGLRVKSRFQGGSVLQIVQPQNIDVTGPLNAGRQRNAYPPSLGGCRKTTALATFCDTLPGGRGLIPPVATASVNRPLVQGQARRPIRPCQGRHHGCCQAPCH